nr:hypothetical protein [uncultured Halomonas sp.]
MDQNELQALIDAIENAEDKDALEVLGKEHLGTDIDKRKGLEALRTQLLEQAEDTPVTAPPEATQPVDAPAAMTGGPAEAHTPQAEVLEPPPKVDPATNGTEETPAAEKDKPRLLENTQNKRRFSWTAALAKLPHMREV